MRQSLRLRPAWTTNRRSIILSIAFAVCLAFSAAGVWFMAEATLPRQVSPPNEAMHLRLHIAGSAKQVSYESNRSFNNTAFSLLLEASRLLHIPVVWQNWTVPSDTVFIQSVGSDVNGEDGRWWQFWINGEYGSVSANHAALSNGDVVEWRFAHYPP